MRSRKSQGLVALGVVGATIGSPLAIVPAAASDFDNDSVWSDEHNICDACSVDDGDVVGMWQHVLWTEGYLSSFNQIDGHFGPVTTSATQAFQKTNGLTSDGVVGPNTWAEARNSPRLPRERRREVLLRAVLPVSTRSRLRARFCDRWFLEVAGVHGLGERLPHLDRSPRHHVPQHLRIAWRPSPGTASHRFFALLPRRSLTMRRCSAPRRSFRTAS